MNILQNYTSIPNLETLRRRLMLYAKLDFLLNIENEADAYYHYDDKNWLTDGDYIRIDNGSGDHFHVLMEKDAAVIMGFAHESPLSPYCPHRPEWMLNHDFFLGLPDQLKDDVMNPALEPECVTFVTWTSNGQNWQFATVPKTLDTFDGSDDFLALAGDLTVYQEWLIDYYEIEWHRCILEELQNGTPFTEEILAKLFPDENATEWLTELREKFRQA
ncbi:hypothetical protein [Listeria costaricensis]|uniref:hypothetical protein n=1 Tax=Listeria costaricensis TaxID=2026604 RepID=UPI000C078114|nr:hypothetical protein [Listeria costaricensis]